MKKKILSLLVLLAAAVSGAWAQTVIGNGWSDDFEGATCKWDLINGSAANKWTLGTATNNGGTQAIYISNDGGTTNTYVSGTGYASTVYAAKLFTFANDEYTFSYDWKANGENNYDYLRVALVPSSVTLTAKATSTDHKSALPTGWIALDGGSRLKKETDWQNKSVTIDVSAGDYYLVFEWINDASTSDDPPAAIDNVSITPSSASSAPVVTFALAAAANEHGTVTFTVNSNEVTEAGEGDLVTVTITPDEGWIVDATSVKAESYSTWEAAGARRRSGAPANITILGDITLTKSTTAENTWTFQMPAASVLVGTGYKKVSTLYFNPAGKTNLVKVTVDGTDRNLNGSKTVKIKRVDNVLEGTAVKLTANTGYKFRKVQVTKTDDGLKLTNPTVGQVIGSDGKNYAYASLPTGVTAVAKICYVSGNSGLALALADESSMMDWATAIETCAAHTPAFKGAEWKLASQDEWNNMKSAAGNYANLRTGFSSVGGTDMRSLQEETYWSSTEQVNSQNAWYMLNSGNWYRHDKSVTKYVRACLAF